MHIYLYTTKVRILYKVSDYGLAQCFHFHFLSLSVRWFLSQCESDSLGCLAVWVQSYPAVSQCFHFYFSATSTYFPSFSSPSFFTENFTLNNAKGTFPNFEKRAVIMLLCNLSSSKHQHLLIYLTGNWLKWTKPLEGDLTTCRGFNYEHT